MSIYSLFARTVLTRMDNDVLTTSGNRRQPGGNNDALQSTLAGALAYKPGQTDVETAQSTQAIQQQLGTSAGRAFLAGDGISGADRIFALEVVTNHPELLTPDAFGREQ